MVRMMPMFCLPGMIARARKPATMPRRIAPIMAGDYPERVAPNLAPNLHGLPGSGRVRSGTSHFPPSGAQLEPRGPVVITCSISGAVANREQCPAIPYTPEEYAAEARAASTRARR
jgi:hypothetical protein